MKKVSTRKAAADNFFFTGSLTQVIKLLIPGLLLFALASGGCQKALNWEVGSTDSTALPPVDTVTAVASYTLAGDSANCSEITVSGDYIQSEPLTAANTVALTVNVNATGKYAFNSDTINGINFSGEGVFTVTGLQKLYAYGSGTPKDTGNFQLNFTADSNACSFWLHISPAATDTSGESTGDFFPVSANSYWEYDDNSGTNPPTPLTITCTGTTATLGGKTYSLFVSGIGDTNYYRKENGQYYQYGPLGYFTSGYIDYPPLIEYEFLKDAPAGTAWETPEYDVTNDGVPVKAKISFEITSRGTTSVLGTPAEYIHVMTTVQQHDPVLGWQEVQRYDAYYAQGIGLTEFADPRRIIRWGGLLDYKVY